MATVRIIRDLTTDTARVSFGYDPGAVSIIKSITSTSRSYDPTTKVWTVAGSVVDDLVWMLTQDGHKVHVTVTGHPPQTSAGWADALFTAVGPDRVDAVYRALTKVLHPDNATGDHDLQQQLNVARDHHTKRGAKH
jgi:HepA-related protein (HARP)